MTQHSYRKLKTGIGELTLVANASHLLAVLWENDDPRRVPIERGKLAPGHPVLRMAEGQIQEYFLGSRKEFDLPISLSGTEFQKRVWGELTKIGYGTTISYSELAHRVGSPRAVRAAGSANGRNPLSIVVPCHRVIGKSGQLSGFAGGVSAKRFLLELESNEDLGKI